MRLRPYTMVLPKPLIPVGEEPVLEHIIRRLAAAGLIRIHLCIGRRLGGLIQTYLTHSARLPGNIEIRYHWEDEPLGTAGALRGVPGLEESFLAMNGDIFTTLDYGELLRCHAETGADLTIAMRRETVDIALGVIECGNGRVTGYREKPSVSYEVSMGIYVYKSSALELLPASGPCQFPDLVLRLIEAGRHVTAYRTDAVWYDIGTLAEYERALSDVLERPELFAA
jgi:NDP-mannose synthase